MPRIVLALAIVAFAGAAQAQTEFTVEQRMLDDPKAVFGTVQSVDVAAARARIGGTVRKLEVDEGSAVKAGEVIATVDDPKLPLQLVAVDARLRSLESQRKLAETDLDRVAKLRQTGAATQARVDEAQTNLDVIRSTAAATQAERAVIAEQLAEGAVLAPADGRVLKVAVTEGAVIMPGETIALIAAERYVLRIELPERHARFIKQGDTVHVGRRGLQTGDEPAVEGTIRQVYPQMESGRVIADVEVPGLGDFFVGERALVHVGTGARPAIVVPRRFLLQRYGVTYALVKGEGEVMVQSGQHLGDEIEVLSGLRPGDVLQQP